MFRSKIPSNLYYLFLILAIVFFLGLIKFSQPVRNLAERALTIPLKQKIYDWQRFLKKDLNGCQLGNEREIAELKAKIVSLTEENISQKRLLSSPLPKNWQFLPVKVVEVKDEVLTVSSGRADGVKEGMIALLDETYIGKVSLVSEKISQIRLPSFFDERLLVKIISADKNSLAKGLLIGRSQGRMKVEQILYSEGTAKGDLVTTDIEDHDLLVGEIEEVSEVKGEVFKTAQVKRLYNPEELNTFFLIRGKL